MGKNKANKPKKKDDAITLGDFLNQDVLEKLKDTKKSLKQEEVRKKEEEELRKHEERRQREKNKSFEELLEESNLNWKSFK